MDFDQTLDFVNSIEFSDDTKPKVETKEGVLRIKDNKIDAPELKLDIKQEVKPAKTVLEETLDFVSTIEFTENVKLKLEIKEEVKLEIKEETLNDKEETANELQTGFNDKCNSNKHISNSHDAKKNSKRFRR